MSLALEVDSLPSEPSGKPQFTLTQSSNVLGHWTKNRVSAASDPEKMLTEIKEIVLSYSKKKKKISKVLSLG